MAMIKPIINRDAHFCRDCGGPLAELFEYYKICNNTTTLGQQQGPKDVCQSLVRVVNSNPA